MTGEERRVREAFAAILLRGEYPSPGRMFQELTGALWAGHTEGKLNGRQTKVWHACLAEAGYAQNPGTGRWFLDNPAIHDHYLTRMRMEGVRG